MQIRDLYRLYYIDCKFIRNENTETIQCLKLLLEIFIDYMQIRDLYRLYYIDCKFIRNENTETIQCLILLLEIFTDYIQIINLSETKIQRQLCRRIFFCFLRLGSFYLPSAVDFRAFDKLQSESREKFHCRIFSLLNILIRVTFK